MSLSFMSRLCDDQPLSEEDEYSWDEDSHDILLRELKMLLTSRVRQAGLEDIDLINSSILNYGIDESFSKINELATRRIILEQRLKNAIARFEPRLTSVSLFSDITEQAILFTLQALYRDVPFTLELQWKDCTGRFYFNE